MIKKKERRKKIAILGSGGRDLREFNKRFRCNPDYEVCFFTKNTDQVPSSVDRIPAKITGKSYPFGIPVYPEKELVERNIQYEVEELYFAYSDVPISHIASLASMAQIHNIDFRLPSFRKSMTKSPMHVISICASRTGAGKTSFTRYLFNRLKDRNCCSAIVRHPMCYSDLDKKEAIYFSKYSDLQKGHFLSIEELEEIEPHLKEGATVYLGSDYDLILANILERRVFDLIIWDGGNNDLPFYRPCLHIVLVDPLRAANMLHYYPTEANLRMAQLIVITKSNLVPWKLDNTKKLIKDINPYALILEGESEIEIVSDEIDFDSAILIEDGPSLVHGGIKWYPEFWKGREFKNLITIPSSGYSPQMINELEKRLNETKADVIISASNSNIFNLMALNKPIIQLEHKFIFDEKEEKQFDRVLDQFAPL